MNTKKPYQSIGKALLLSGVVMATSLVAPAQAQELNFAQKLLSTTPSGDMGGTQFRSTIIDPSSRGKVTATNGSTLRVIPISNPTERSQDHSCTICGVVESISITLRERTGAEAYDENALENISSHVKRQHGLLLARNGAALSPDGDKVQKKAATIYEIKVRMNDGTLRIVSANRHPDYTVGDYVRVISGAVIAA